MPDDLASSYADVFCIDLVPINTKTFINVELTFPAMISLLVPTKMAVKTKMTRIKWHFLVLRVKHDKKYEKII